MMFMGNRLCIISTDNLDLELWVTDYPDETFSEQLSELTDEELFDTVENLYFLNEKEIPLLKKNRQELVELIFNYAAVNYI